MNYRKLKLDNITKYYLFTWIEGEQISSYHTCGSRSQLTDIIEKNLGNTLHRDLKVFEFDEPICLEDFETLTKRKLFGAIGYGGVGRLEWIEDEAENKTEEKKEISKNNKLKFLNS